MYSIEFNGFGGQMMAWAIMLVAYSIVFIGLYILVSYVIIDWLFTWAVKATKNWNLIIQFIYYRKKFKKWAKDNPDIEQPPSPIKQ